MKHVIIGLTAFGALAAASGNALADHNSKWGEGWANMPNDIHNTRVETRGDDDAFRDFVQKGAGAESVNRFDSEGANGRSETFGKGKAKQEAAGNGKDAAGQGKRPSAAATKAGDKLDKRSRGRMSGFTRSTGAFGTRGRARSGGPRGH